MQSSGKQLCLLGQFRPFGQEVEAALAGRNEEEVEATSSSYVLFDPEMCRERSRGFEQTVMSASSNDHEEEIFIQENSVIWSAGKKVRKRFTSPTSVIQATWCYLESVSEPVLCVLHSDSLTTYTPSGEMNSVPLPCTMASMWSLPCGLLLQRAVSDLYTGLSPSPPITARDHLRGGISNYSISRAAPMHTSRRGSTPSVATNTVSMYFTLRHPLEEAEVLQYEEAGKLWPMDDTEEKIIWTSNVAPYIVSYHKARMQHSIWQIKVPSKNKGHPSSARITGPTRNVQEVLPAITLELVWQEKSSQPQATQVFMATDEDGVPLLCFLVAEQKKLFTFRMLFMDLFQDNTATILDIAWTISAASASPIIATRPRLRRNGLPHFDLFVLAPDGNLFLYTGRFPLCMYYLPISEVLIYEKERIYYETLLVIEDCQNNIHDVGGKVEVLELCDAVKNRVNLVTSSGEVYRCAVPLIPSSGITISCLMALAEGVRPSFYRYLLSSLLEYKNPALETWYGASKTDSCPDTEWGTFSGVIMQWVSKCKAGKSERMDDKPVSAWEFLLRSSMHRNMVMNFSYTGRALSRTTNAIKVLTRPPVIEEDGSMESTGYTAMLAEILEALHAVYEDYKLDTLRWRDLWKLGALLSNVAVAVGEFDYVDHYLRDFPTTMPFLPRYFKLAAGSSLMFPANLLSWLEKCIARRNDMKGTLPNLLTKGTCVSVDWSRKVVGFYEILLGAIPIDCCLPSGIYMKIADGTTKNAEQRALLAMVGEGFGLSDLDRLPPGVALPLRHALNSCREAPPQDWPADAYILAGREDLASTCVDRKSMSGRSAYQFGSCNVRSAVSMMDVNDVMLAAPYMLHLRPTITSFGDSQDRLHLEAQSVGGNEGRLNDGMEHIFSPSAMLRFGRDLRLDEVRRLLCSSRPVAVRTANAPDVSDPDIVAQQQAQLWQLAQRTTALPVGRGAFTLATLRPLLTEALPISKLVLAGRLPSQHDATVNLDANAGNIADLTSWPDFHNGVAAGLRLAPGQAKITRTWILYNKPDEPSYEHAGLLMSFGLHKHLAVLAATDVFRYLAQEHDPTTVGILLGMAAAHRGTMDPAISKMLYLHIPARHPPSFPELELSSLLQSAALMAVGLLYQGSAHRLTTEILLAEIGRKPGGDNSLDREGYALAAGLALGLVVLGRGKDAWGLADLLIEDRLRHYMSGGSEPSDNRRRKFDTIYPLPGAMKGMDDICQAGGQVMEGSIVNLDATAPGATLALALMFLKTNDKVIAARLAIPDTHFALEYVRPDFILLRLVARSLILWDSVVPTEEWIQSQVPEIVKAAVSHIREGGKGACEGKLANADMEALAQAHVNILAGACLSIGLRYAGSSSAAAQELLYRHALYFMKEKASAAAIGGSNASDGGRTFVDRGTLETCLNVAVLSLSVVMAGSGHLQTFKLLRYLRRRNDAEGSLNYGNHMAISMAIGFLFLGGGSLTFATNDGAIAALLISLYPRFPNTPSDHRCHLQAFRHLYVLATEPRCVQTVDVDTGQLVYAPLEMTLKETSVYSETSFCRVTPCMLPERSSLKRVQVCGPRYWPQDIHLSYNGKGPWWGPAEKGDPFNGGILYVKRKVGARSYADDPIGCRSLLSRALHRVSHVNKVNPKNKVKMDTHLGDQFDQLVGTFSYDPSLLAFAQLFCDQSYGDSSSNEFEDFCLLALFECVSLDRPALLQTYLSMYTTVEVFVDIATKRGSSAIIGSFHSLSLSTLKVALAYTEALGQGSESPCQGQSLVQQTFISALAKRIDEILGHLHVPNVDMQGPENVLISYFNYQWPPESNLDKSQSGEMLESDLIQRFIFSSYLLWHDIPKPSLVNAAVQSVCQVFPEFRKSGVDATMTLPLLAMLLPGTPTSTLIQINNCLPYLVTGS